MSHKYEAGATIVPADCFAPGGAEAAVLIYGELQNALSSRRRDEFNAIFSGLLSDGFEVEMQGDGSLYVASGPDYFSPGSLQYLAQKLAERKLLVKSFSLQIAYYCDDRDPDEHGGACYRVLPSGEVLAISTQLDDLTDEQFRRLAQYRERPDAFAITEL